MQTFRCYALNAGGRIVAADYVEADDLTCALGFGWEMVASRPAAEMAVGLEVWQGRILRFSTCSTFAGYREPGSITDAPGQPSGLTTL